MKHLKFAVAVATATLLGASAASATITLTTGNVGGTGVHADGTTDETGTTVLGTVGIGGELVTFSSSSTLTLNGSGEAIIQPSSGLLGDLLVSFVTGKEIVGFNVELPTGRDAPKGPFDMTILVNGVDSFTVNPLKAPEKYYLTASDLGDAIDTIAFSFTPGVGDLKQFRVTGFNAVPEPATWAVMLLGFGGIGAAMRRSRRAAALA
jgi:hypothetical protein